MPANMENSAVTTGLEKVSFHSKPKEGQCQRMFKLPYNCTHFTCQQSNAQNSPSPTSPLYELRTSRFSRWILEKAEEPEIKLQRIPEKHLLLLDYAKASDCVDQNKLWKILKEMGIPDHLTCLLSNLYAGQEATVRTRPVTMDWFKMGKGVRQGCIFLPCLFNL